MENSTQFKEFLKEHNLDFDKIPGAMDFLLDNLEKFQELQVIDNKLKHHAEEDLFESLYYYLGDIYRERHGTDAEWHEIEEEFGL